MRRRVVSPDGSRWIVQRVTSPWRLRHRVEFAGDPVGILLWLGAWVVLLGEAVVWAIAWMIQSLRHRLGVPWVIEATTVNPPLRVLRWRVVGNAASRERAGAIAAALAAGDEVASTADEREVGA